jgi:hypothetical protein
MSRTAVDKNAPSLAAKEAGFRAIPKANQPGGRVLAWRCDTALQFDGKHWQQFGPIVTDEAKK